MPQILNNKNMKKHFFALIYLLFSGAICAQDITFCGYDNSGSKVVLNRVVITNHSKGWQGIVYGPDTALNMLALSEVDYFIEDGELVFSSAVPNPFEGSTRICLTVADRGDVSLIITDAGGHLQAMYSAFLESGAHTFRVSLADKGTYFLSARQEKKAASAILVCDKGGVNNRIEYEGGDIPEQLTPQDIINAEDDMEFSAYATIDDEEQVVSVWQRLGASDIVVFDMSKARKAVKAVRSNSSASNFRIALSLSPFTLKQFNEGYSFKVGEEVATTPKQLQQIYNNLGSTEMFVRIATKRHVTEHDVTDGEKDENANVHTFDQALELCRIAAELNIPINPEIMCAYTYMDMDKTQPPRFEQYPEFYHLQKGKKWSDMSLDELCVVLEAYGTFLGDSILATGCTVKNWNIGNEANFGFAGIGMGQDNAVDKQMASASQLKRYTASIFSVWWLKKHVWKYEAKLLAAVKRGVLKSYQKAGLDASDVKFSTHIATVVFTPRCSASFFRTMKEHGYTMETAGISYYPSAPAMSLNRAKLLTNTVTRIHKKCGIPVFIAEFSYPSGQMDGAFAGWNKTLGRYGKNQQGQADVYRDVVAWGMDHGMAGIRYWAPDYEGWYAMSVFSFKNKVGTAKLILTNHKSLVRK